MNSLVAACLWVLAASIAGMLPSRRNHWPAAWALMATGLPLLGWIWAAQGPWIALFCLLGALSILRWPALYAWRWLAARFRTQQ